MRAPFGVIPGICTVTSAYSLTGIWYILYTLAESTEKLTPILILSVTLMFPAIIFLGIVPWIITKPVQDENTVHLQSARKNLMIGTILFLASLLLIPVNGIYKGNIATIKQSSMTESSQEK